MPTEVLDQNGAYKYQTQDLSFPVFEQSYRRNMAQKIWKSLMDTITNINKTLYFSLKCWISRVTNYRESVQ